MTDIARGEENFFVPIEHHSPLTRLNSNFHKDLQVQYSSLCQQLPSHCSDLHFSTIYAMLMSPAKGEQMVLILVFFPHGNSNQAIKGARPRLANNTNKCQNSACILSFTA